MRWEYKVSLFLLLLSQVIFLGLAAYHTQGLLSGEGTYSWIWYHPEHWFFSLSLSVIALLLFVYAAITDIKPDWKF